MRRRSERKKSTEVCSTPVSRRTSRRSRKTSEPINEQNVGTALEVVQAEKEETLNADDNENVCVSTTRRGRSRNCTPVTESSPAKTHILGLDGPDAKIATIVEEKNGNATEIAAAVEQDVDRNMAATVDSIAVEEVKTVEVVDDSLCSREATTITSSLPFIQGTNVDESTKPLDVLEIQTDEQDEEKQTPSEETTPDSKSINKGEIKTANAFEENTDTTPNSQSAKPPKPLDEADAAEGNTTRGPDSEVIAEGRGPTVDVSPARLIEENKVANGSNEQCDNGRTRKRKWITKKTCESKVPVLAISTDSLKNLIADVHPVPLSDIQLGSSSEVEEVASEREEGEETPSPEREIRRRVSTDNKAEKVKQRSQNDHADATMPGHQQGAGKTSTPLQRSPSPPRNEASSFLYITNLVRPFTVLQLKGLLARTGKIMEDGFWIDRIKSKCYVQYETEDEAIETRHALHGVRWPVSNPKCLNVDFGSKSDMERAIQSTKDELPKFGQDNNKDNLIVGSGWNRERDFDEKKTAKPVREWDVGKKESIDRDKLRDAEKLRSKDKELSGNHNSERGDDKERKSRGKGREQRSSSLSPVRKAKKKENDPPLRLLDDLFRKTKATPCIYWLPLTPEQIAEKEAFRQKRIEEHKLRIKQRELERGKEREKERNRSDRGRDRDREHRRNRSTERRSRSRDRRRY